MQGNMIIMRIERKVNRLANKQLNKFEGEPIRFLGMNISARFRNPNFILRFIAALLIPALASIGIDWRELTTWAALGAALMDIISNPVVIGLIIYNALNMMPDGLVRGWKDSPQGLDYKKPKENK